MRSAVEQEIRDLVQKNGPITFAQFMQTYLYSPRGGFYSARGDRINAHFGTSATSHPVFGALIARQLEQMWHLLGDPSVFHVIEVGSGDGALAHSIVNACWRLAPRFSQAINYIATDYEPRGFQSPDNTFEWNPETAYGMASRFRGSFSEIQPVKGDGLRAFRNIVGCVLSNELIDNFPVHRFAIQDGRVQEIFVTTDEGKFTEILGEPSSPCIQERLTGLGLSLPEGFRGEVNLAIEDWAVQLSSALDRGFILTIDYGQLAPDLYSPKNGRGTIVCHHRHSVSDDPYQRIGKQDITCQVDFTSLMEVGDEYGLTTVGYVLQSQFLENLGFSSFVDALQMWGLSAARMELNRIAMMTLVDAEEYGDFKVLAQAKGVELDSDLLGFQGHAT
ncbi:MAG: class I SAM-dependent methyltransferase [Dehalococcoidia bacterium]